MGWGVDSAKFSAGTDTTPEPRLMRGLDLPSDDCESDDLLPTRMS